MPKSKISILSTAPLDEALVGQAASKNIIVDVLSFTEIEFDLSTATEKLVKQALDAPANVVFTSVNTVNVVAAKLQTQKPSWKIFCIGYATRDLVEKTFGKELIAGTAENAAGLADQIISSGVRDILFFCGRQRRNELPDRLAEKKISVTEIILYQTVPTTHVVGKIYDGVIFFSPGAVQSFYQSNQPNQFPVLFAIGHTTGNEVKKYITTTQDVKIIISDKPAKPELIETVINYFENHSIHQ